MSQIVREWFGDVLTFDTRLWRTLVPLIRRPGFLTLEYLAGRRARYVPPLRLFVFLSLVMFLVLAAIGVEFAWKVTGDEGQVIAYDPREAATRDSRTQREAPLPDAAAGSGGAQEPEVGSDRLSEALADPEEVSRRMLDYSPQAMFVLVPAFAGFLWLLHRRREALYVPHLIFSLHLHAFVFLVVLSANLLDQPFPDQRGPGKAVIFVALPIYLYLAQKRVYGGGRLANVLRTSGLLVVHFSAWVLLMVGVLGLVVLGG